MKNKIEAKLAKFVIKKQSPPRENFIEENIKKITLWNKINEKDREYRTILFKQRRERAIKIKEKMFIEKIRQNIYYMNRWNIVREKRKDIELMEKAEERKQLFKFWWIRK